MLSCFNLSFIYRSKQKLVKVLPREVKIKMWLLLRKLNVVFKKKYTNTISMRAYGLQEHGNYIYDLFTTKSFTL